MSELAKELQLDTIDETLIINDEKEEITMEDFFQNALNDLVKFDEASWSKGDGFKLPNFPHITESLEGLDSGLYLFAGKSNHGKSAIMTNLMYDACHYEPNNLLGIYYSLDDSKNEIIPRIIAMDQIIPIGVASKPQRYQNKIDKGEEGAYEYREMLVKRQAGLDKMKANVNRMIIEDSSKVKNIDDMYNHIKMVRTYIRSINPEYRLLIAIDSINDIRLTHMPKDNDTLAEIARTVKNWTVEFDCPIFASTHIRKLNGNRRPTLDDLKDSSVLVYEASVVFIVYNDVSENKEGANIYQTGPDQTKLPVLELDWAKNKKSSYKGRSFCFFSPQYSKARECTDEDRLRYNGLIHSA